MSAAADSTVPGFLAPPGAPPVGDLARDVAVQQTVAGVLGFALDNVRPRWQQVMPPQFEITVDWAAIGVSAVDTPLRAAVLHHGEDDGYDEIQQQETLTVQISLYGPHADTNYGVLRDGLQNWQNRSAMFVYGLVFVELSRSTIVPQLNNDLWQRRVDTTLTLRRQVTRTYAVKNLLQAEGAIERDDAAGDVTQTAWSTLNVEE